MFREFIGMLRDMLTPFVYIGKGFQKYCGKHFVYFTIGTHPSREFTEVGVPRCRATVTIPQHPILGWQSLEIEVVGYRLVDTFEAAALKAITTFCEQHPEEVAAYPIGLFLTVFAHDAEWIYRTNHFGHLGGNFTEETLRTVIRYMNAQYRLQSLKQKCMDDMVNLAQDFHRDLTLKDDQIHSLGQGIAGRDTTIGHLEVHILEGDAQILQRNTVIDFLQEQVHDLNQELGDALGHIEMLQE
jgi:hypothetical protein